MVSKAGFRKETKCAWKWHQCKLREKSWIQTNKQKNSLQKKKEEAIADFGKRRKNFPFFPCPQYGLNLIIRRAIAYAQGMWKMSSLSLGYAWMHVASQENGRRKKAFFGDFFIHPYVHTTNDIIPHLYTLYTSQHILLDSIYSNTEREKGFLSQHTWRWMIDFKDQWNKWRRRSSMTQLRC